MSNFYNELYELKNVLRKGWQEWEVAEGNPIRLESDAEHTCSMALLAMRIIAKRHLKLDEAKVYKMILVHELGEIDVGDISPWDKVDLDRKYNLEKTAVNRIAKTYDFDEALQLWLEFEENKTPEAQFVKMLDKLDTVAQCKIYSEKAHKPQMYEEFYIRWKDRIAGYEEFI